MKRQLLRRVEARIRHQIGIEPRWVTELLLGRALVVRNGTLRPEPDYDDAWLHACAQHAKVMFDVGANVGQSALVSLLAGVEQIMLVEANWEALAVAAQNLIRNGLGDRTRYVTAFASDVTASSVEFWTVGTGAAGSMFRGAAVTAARAGQVQTVPTATLDDLSDRHALVPDLVKIDVEGAESRVLAGSTRIASRMGTRFMVEMHSPPELTMARNAELVLDWARSVDYSAWYLSKAVRLESADAVATRGRCHLLLQPSAWPYPEWLVGIAQSATLPSS